MFQLCVASLRFGFVLASLFHFCVRSVRVIPFPDRSAGRGFLLWFNCICKWGERSCSDLSSSEEPQTLRGLAEKHTQTRQQYPGWLASRSTIAFYIQTLLYVLTFPWCVFDHNNHEILLISYLSLSLFFNKFIFNKLSGPAPPKRPAPPKPPPPPNQTH